MAKKKTSKTKTSTGRAKAKSSTQKKKLATKATMKDKKKAVSKKAATVNKKAAKKKVEPIKKAQTTKEVIPKPKKVSAKNDTTSKQKALIDGPLVATDKEKAMKSKELGNKAKSLKSALKEKTPVRKKRKTKAEVSAQENMDKMAKKWVSLHNRSEAKGIKPVPYNMKNMYEAKTAINHKVLGWGYIISNVNNRLEVLFEDGVKYLISNYK